LTKNGKIYSGEKTASSVNGAGKSGQQCVYLKILMESNYE